MNELPPPVTKEVAGAYIYEWDAENIQIRASRIKVHHSDGSVSGEINIRCRGQHLHQAQINFSASRSRSMLAKDLSARIDDIDWFAAIEFACVLTLRKSRSGEPLSKLTTAMDNITPPRVLLDPFVVENYPTVFFGDPGSSKTTIATVLAQLLGLPWIDNPLGVTTPVDPVKVLYLDWESDQKTILWLMKKLQVGMGIKLELAMDYQRCALPLALDLEMIRDRLEESEASAVIIDSLGLAAGGELNDSQPAIAFFTGLRQLNVTSIILAHTAKNPDDKTKRSIYGNLYYTAQARSIWEVKKSQETGSSEMDLVFLHKKTTPFQQLSHPIGMHVSFTDTSTVVSAGKPETVDEFLQSLSTRTQIISILKEGPLMPEEIVKRTNAKRNTVDQTLSRLKRDNKIIRVPGGWALMAQSEFGDGDNE